jgi:hypothetical protein
MMIRRNHCEKGASIAEAVTGLIILIPIVLILIDISAIVLTQTANDDLAKHAARLAAGQTTPQLRQAAATSVVNNYPPSTMTSSPSLVSYSEPNAQQVTVSTSMVCNLPVQVPFGGPTKQQFTAFATEPIVSSLQTATTGSAPPSIGTNSWGQQDDLGYINVHLQTGQGGNPTAIGPLIPNAGEFSGGSGTTGSGSGSGAGLGGGSSGNGNNGSGSGTSGPISVGPSKGGK